MPARGIKDWESPLEEMLMFNGRTVSGVAVALLLIGAANMSVAAIAPTDAEMGQRDAWVAAKFSGDVSTSQPTGLVVQKNYGPVQRNARDGQPLRIAETTYTHGLFCHAPSVLRVQLPAPATRFQATVGIDTNGQYSGGSVDFIVRAGDRQLYKSRILRRDMPGAVVDLKLPDLHIVELRVGDAGDNFNSDQAAWADAKFTLSDGSEVRLGDLPIIEQDSGFVDTSPPFSFTYNGKPSRDFLADWQTTRSTRKLDSKRLERAVTYSDPATSLSVTCTAVTYDDYPTVEWLLHFRNDGTTDTPIIENIQALDVSIERGSKPEFVLHHFVGSVCEPRDYQPLRTVLAASEKKRITTNGGRPTNSDMPYFNIEKPGGGLIAVIGWAGQWAAEFQRDDAIGLRITAGQELTHFVLHPGEEVRGPLGLLQFYEGDMVRAQNIWRRWMIAHNQPRPTGKPLKPTLSFCNGNHFPQLMGSAKEEMHFLARYAEEKIAGDYWWQDAGWYQCSPDGWPKTGTWEVDRERFPKGIREVSDFARTHGTKTIVWFEPERVMPGTWLYENHPEWLLGPDGRQKLLWLGNPAARKWVTDHVSQMLTEQGIDLYRQDFNIDPLQFWRANDAPDRQGITEIRHVEGYLAYWDALIARHPGLLIDSCASGGRRNDIETLRRAVPLLRSDYIFEPVGEQCHTYGISFWIPFNGTGFIDINEYLVRSVMAPEFTLGPDVRRKDLDYDTLRRLVAEWRECSDCFLGDYYPLSSYSLENDAWMAWQFDRPDLGRGIVQAFRRGASPVFGCEYKLKGLQPDGRYVLRNMDNTDETTASGQEFMDKGLKIQINQQAKAVTLTYGLAK